MSAKECFYSDKYLKFSVQGMRRFADGFSVAKNICLSFMFFIYIIYNKKRKWQKV